MRHILQSIVKLSRQKTQEIGRIVKSEVAHLIDSFNLFLWFRFLLLFLLIVLFLLYFLLLKLNFVHLRFINSDHVHD